MIKNDCLAHTEQKRRAGGFTLMNNNERDKIHERIREIESEVFPQIDEELDTLEDIYRKKLREQGKTEYTERARKIYLDKYSEYENVCDEYQQLLKIIRKE